jgi:hypothetical protein
VLFRSRLWSDSNGYNFNICPTSNLSAQLSLGAANLYYNNIYLYASYIFTNGAWFNMGAGKMDFYPSNDPATVAGKCTLYCKADGNGLVRLYLKVPTGQAYAITLQ